MTIDGHTRQFIAALRLRRVSPAELYAAVDRSVHLDHGQWPDGDRRLYAGLPPDRLGIERWHDVAGDGAAACSWA
jgi:hypothetical protein